MQVNPFNQQTEFFSQVDYGWLFNRTLTKTGIEIHNAKTGKATRINVKPPVLQNIQV